MPATQWITGKRLDAEEFLCRWEAASMGWAFSHLTKWAPGK
jgi:hypothetical protein